MRRVVAFASMLALTGCTGFINSPWFSLGPQYPQPEFGVSALQAPSLPPAQAMFNRNDPSLVDVHAAQICTLGYKKVAESSVPADPGEFRVARVACNPYRLSFAPALPY